MKEQQYILTKDIAFSARFLSRIARHVAVETKPVVSMVVSDMAENFAKKVLKQK